MDFIFVENKNLITDTDSVTLDYHIEFDNNLCELS